MARGEVGSQGKHFVWPAEIQRRAAFEAEEGNGPCLCVWLAGDWSGFHGTILPWSALWHNDKDAAETAISSQPFSLDGWKASRQSGNKPCFTSRVLRHERSIYKSRLMLATIYIPIFECFAQFWHCGARQALPGSLVDKVVKR
jgi:hypothetical protein